MSKMKLVMVGNGMAGVRTLEELLKLAPDLFDITVFGSEIHPNYNRILLSPVLAGEQSLDEIILNPLSWYQDNGITLHTGCTVTQVDRVKREVHSGQSLRSTVVGHGSQSIYVAHSRQRLERRFGLPRHCRYPSHD